MSPNHDQFGPSTLSIHGGEPRRQLNDAIPTPIFLTSSYTFETMEEVLDYVTGKKARFEYGRYGNPTVAAAIEKLRILEGAEDGEVFDCGMSADTCAILGLLQAGDHLVITDDAYKKTLLFVEKTLPRFGITASIVPMGDYDAMESAIRKNPKTRMVVSESPTNPYLNIADMDALRSLKEKYGFILAVDSTFATPINQRCLSQGADLVMYSTTKYMGGHNDLLGGGVFGSKELVSKVRDYRNTTGGVMDPMTAYLLLRGLKTLSLRMERHNASALTLARWLETQPKVRRVYYPGLPSHRHHHLATKYMTGFGGVVTMELETDFAGVTRFLEALKIFKIGPSFGGAEALITHPMTISYYNYTPEERKRLGILDELIRISTGLEDCTDLLRDLEAGLAAI
jgi:cystathionine gamma-synthase